MWEDDHNRNGGCMSYKIMKPEVPDAWLRLCGHVLGESLLDQNLRTENYEEVCGISISPKKNYCILRIWIASPKMSEVENLTLTVPSYTTVLYKSHTQHREFEV